MSEYNSEWQTETNQWGGTRRYRMTPYGKEYELEITTSNGTYTQSQIDSGINRKKPVLPKVHLEKKFCPFSSGSRSSCRKNCSYWSEAGCMQSADTAGRKCPISLYTCDSDCKLYVNDGCSLIRKEK